MTLTWTGCSWVNQTLFSSQASVRAHSDGLLRIGWERTCFCISKRTVDISTWILQEQLWLRATFSSSTDTPYQITFLVLRQRNLRGISLLQKTRDPSKSIMISSFISGSKSSTIIYIRVEPWVLHILCLIENGRERRKRRRYVKLKSFLRSVG